MRRVGPECWRAQRWKNGGGVTHELWRERGLSPDFALRISCAEVAASGPFSSFPAVDRTIVLASGAGFTLVRDDGLTTTLDVVGASWRFSGDDVWDCRLIDGPVLDLNVMTERATVVADVTTHRLLPSSSLVVSAPTAVAFVLEGTGVVATSDGRELCLGARDLVVAAGDLTLAVADTALVVVGVIRPAPRVRRRVTTDVELAYQRAVVEVFADPDTGGERPGCERPALEPCWVVTACNPGAHRLSDDENARRMALLQAAVEARGIVWAPAVSRSADGQWREASLALVGCGAAAALALATAFDQDAIYELRPGSGPEVLWCPGIER
jgi:environmental stress-induced protein Ves